MAHLDDPFTLRSVTLRNRIGVSPMCQYSSEDGFANDWHLVHLGSRAVGGAGLVIAEATAVEARGRITPHDLGIWKDEHVAELARIARFVAAQGAAPAIQLAHAGRKASVTRPWEGNRNLDSASGGWPIVAPSAIPFAEGGLVPEALTTAEIAIVHRAFRDGAARALEAGFRWVELHCAHGYLAHEFLSPLANHRADAYGGSFDGRVRFVVELVRAVREVWPESLPLAIRISATDWTPGGWTIEDSVSLAKRVAAEGVDLVDCSSGAIVPGVKIPVAPCYQVPLAAQVRAEAGVPTAAVGLITTRDEAEAIVAEGRADLVLLARELLRDPYFALRAHAAKAPDPYARAFG